MVNNHQHWYLLTSVNNRNLQYNVEIGEEVKTCEYFIKKTTPCKHIVYVYLNALNLPEDSELLHQMYLTKSELNNIFEGKVKSYSIEMTPKVLMETTSTEGIEGNNFYRRY